MQRYHGGWVDGDEVDIVRWRQVLRYDEENFCLFCIVPNTQSLTHSLRHTITHALINIPLSLFKRNYPPPDICWPGAEYSNIHVLNRSTIVSITITGSAVIVLMKS